MLYISNHSRSTLIVRILSSEAKRDLDKANEMNPRQFEIVTFTAFNEKKAALVAEAATMTPR